MDLITFREQFAKTSGRLDLVVDGAGDDWKDNGADFYIQGGQDYLDRHMTTPKTVNTIFDELKAGEWYLTFEKCRSIRDVWINNTEGRSKLVKKDLVWLYQEYSALVSTTDRGTPLYYCPARLRSTSSIDQTSLGTFFNYILDDSDAKRGVLILAPPDETIVVEVQGLFYSTALSADKGESYWTIAHSDILLMAALRQLEIFFRGSKSVTAWDKPIEEALMGLEKDQIEEEIDEITEIKG